MVPTIDFFMIVSHDAAHKLNEALTAHKLASYVVVTYDRNGKNLRAFGQISNLLVTLQYVRSTTHNDL